MQLDQAVKGRRSIRKYKKEIPDKKLIDKCIEAACYAPSAHGAEPWKFAVVTDPTKIKILSKTQTWSAFLAGAPAVIVVLADEAKSNHWMEDCSCATMLLMLKAHELGLGTCWNAVYQPEKPESRKREEYVLNLLGLKDYRVLCNIGIGYPDEKKGEKKIRFESAMIE